ncbi:MAG: HAMP domain-containing protein [Candidatus Omnitrophica bacterium]|nr:HAMP domain-containing protein [Candidatus Omnitrophota bacterium]
MKKTGSQNRRRNHFIKKRFQAKFILKFCLLIILSCFLMGVLVYFLSAKTTTTSFEDLHLIVKSTADFILPALVLSSLIAIIIISLASVGVVLFISHRIAGPLYRFEKSIEQIANGDLTVNTHLREKDEIKILADSLNELVNKMRESIAASQRGVTELENKAIHVKERLTKLGIAQNEIDEILKPCETVLIQLKQDLSHFKVK